MDRYSNRKPGRRPSFTTTFKKQAVEYILKNDITHRAAAKYFNVSHGLIYRWIKAYHTEIEDLNPIGTMATVSPAVHRNDNCDEQINLLQNALNLAQLKVTGLETMIDLAESTYKISIRKNFGTKQNE